MQFLYLLPLYIHRGLGTTQFASRDKKSLATIFVMKVKYWGHFKLQPKEQYAGKGD